MRQVSICMWFESWTMWALPLLFSLSDHLLPSLPFTNPSTLWADQDDSKLGKNVSIDAAALITKSAELFIQDLVAKSLLTTKSHGAAGAAQSAGGRGGAAMSSAATTINYGDVSSQVDRYGERFSFLADVIPPQKTLAQLHEQQQQQQQQLQQQQQQQQQQV